MKLRHLYPALLLGLAPTATHAEMTRMSYSQLADVSGQAYYISLGSVDIPFGFNLWWYSHEKLDKAEHLYELEKDENLTLSLDAAHRGVGGDLPGCTVLHRPYKVLIHKPYSFTFRISKL